MKFVLSAFLGLGLVQSTMAGLSFESPRIDTKAEPGVELVTNKYTFVNATTEVLTIKEVDAGCSCLAVKVAGNKMTYQPGEKGAIEAVFEVGNAQGIVDKPIYLWLDNDPELAPSQTLHLRVQIPTLIAIEPKSLQWVVGKGMEAQMMDIRMDHEKAIHVNDVSISSESFAVELITLEKGKHYQIKVKPLENKSPGLGIIRIDTDAPVEKLRSQQGFAVMKAGKS